MILLATKAGVKIILPIHKLLLRLLLSDKDPHTFFENKNSFLENENSIFVKKKNGTYHNKNQWKLNAFIEEPLNYMVLENKEVKRLRNNNGNVKPAAALRQEPTNNNGNVKPVAALRQEPTNNNRNVKSAAALRQEPTNNNGNNDNNNGNNDNNNENNINLRGGKRFNNYNKSNQSKLLFGMFLHSQNFSTIKQFNQMKKFIITYWKPNPTIFTTKIDYSYEEFIKRLLFIFNGNRIDIKTFEKEEFKKYNTYPLIKLLLAYLKHSEQYRMTFTAFTCGSYTYDGIIKIIINDYEIHGLRPNPNLPPKPPFVAHTCFHYIDINIDLRPGCECPDVFTSTLSDERNKNTNRDICGYSLSKLNREFENLEFSLR
jgi:hypothetical protein